MFNFPVVRPHLKNFKKAKNFLLEALLKVALPYFTDYNALLLGVKATFSNFLQSKFFCQRGISEASFT